MGTRIKAFLDWQWQGYAPRHGDPLNRLLHAATAPLVVGALPLAAWAAAEAHWGVLGLAPLMPAAALLAQGWGHAREPVQPEPFAGPGDFVRRFLAEQLVTFPRFLLSGFRGARR
ncbi:MAG TPA: hypothetical protein VEB20_07895 [Azospirillaceae bacterium]|nr:hypothetical protein [Azospirillaceae bacterium]